MSARSRFRGRRGLPSPIFLIPQPYPASRFPGCRVPLPCSLTHSSNGRFPEPAISPVSMGAEVFRPPPPLFRIWLPSPIFRLYRATHDATSLLRRNPIPAPQPYDATQESRGGFRGPSFGPRFAASEILLRPFSLFEGPLPRSVFLRATSCAPTLQPDNR